MPFKTVYWASRALLIILTYSILVLALFYHRTSTATMIDSALALMLG